MNMNMKKSSLEIWNEDNYKNLRKHLEDFYFSPCAFCISCEIASENKEDFFSNAHGYLGGQPLGCWFIRHP